MGNGTSKVLEAEGVGLGGWIAGRGSGIRGKTGDEGKA